MIDIFFIVDKTNSLLKATGWDMHTISAQVNMLDMMIKIRANLNGETIDTAHLPYNDLTNDTLDNQKILVGKLHRFAVYAYTHHSTTPPEPRNSN